MSSPRSSSSEKLFAEACRHLVGGVNSPVRAFRAVGGVPRFIAKAKGPYLFDVEGRRYVDFVGSWGPMILGHNPSAVMVAVQKALRAGVSFGAPTALEIDLAALIKEALPSIELIRLTSSGTEATMSALRLARAVTKRERMVKFEGAYHGHSDALLVAAGSGATTFGVPSSEGVATGVARNMWVLPFNDTTALEDLFRSQGPNVAAVIVEPVCGNMGVVAPSPGFLKKLRQLTQRYGALLIFDEVMTGFRLAWGGAQTIFDIQPDITCLGKIIGGGFPVGAFGGRRALMEKIAPLGPVYHAGTLSGNPVAMAAGVATLKALKAAQPYAALEARVLELAEHIRAQAARHGIEVQVNTMGSMFTVFFSSLPVTNYFSATESDTDRYAAFFHACLENGLYLPPSQFEAAFIGTTHTSNVMKSAKQAFSRAFSALAAS